MKDLLGMNLQFFLICKTNQMSHWNAAFSFFIQRMNSGLCKTGKSRSLKKRKKIVEREEKRLKKRGEISLFFASIDYDASEKAEKRGLPETCRSEIWPGKEKNEKKKGFSNHFFRDEEIRGRGRYEKLTELK